METKLNRVNKYAQINENGRMHKFLGVIFDENLKFYSHIALYVGAFWSFRINANLLYFNVFKFNLLHQCLERNP